MKRECCIIIEDVKRKYNLGAISQKILGRKFALKLVYFVLEKELIKIGEMAPWIRIAH